MRVAGDTARLMALNDPKHKNRDAAPTVGLQLAMVERRAAISRGTGGTAEPPRTPSRTPWALSR